MQSCVEIESYTIACFDCIISFEVPYCRTSVKNRDHMGWRLYVPNTKPEPRWSVILKGYSGIAKLGHTGACVLATRGCDPPVLLKIISAECTAINHESGTKSGPRCWNQAAQHSYLHPQINEVSYASPISMYACLPQVLQWPYAACVHVRSEGLVKVLQIQNDKVASEST